MRFKIKVDIDTIPVESIVIETAKRVHKLLGDNNKWHDLERKPFTCSFILGNETHGKTLFFKENGYLYINTEDNEIIDVLMSNNINFSVENTKLFNGYNLLSAKKVIFNTDGKKNWVTEDNKSKFILYVKNKYAVDIEILKIRNSSVTYKNKVKLPVSDLLIRCNSNKNIANLFESGIGGSCSLGFGFVETIKKY